MSRGFYWLGLLYAAIPVLACAYDAYEVAATELEQQHAINWLTIFDGGGNHDQRFSGVSGCATRREPSPRGQCHRYLQSAGRGCRGHHRSQPEQS
jgi:hypothetical protein